MAQSLAEIAKTLNNANKKVQLIYAFNGTGKTRLSREFKKLIAPKNQEEQEVVVQPKIKIMYYNAFTEDLFYWDNDLLNDEDRKLKIQPNGYTGWILKDQGQEPNITAHFQRYTNDKLTPKFSEDFSEVRFSFERGNYEPSEFVKISKGEESCFIWSIFYSLLAQTINVLNVLEVADRETNQFNDLQYVFIDDPVSSLDDNHLIELAVNLAELIRKSNGLKFVISTHNPLFYNVLFNELNLRNNNGCYMLSKNDDDTYNLTNKSGDSNKSFSYHLYLIHTIEEAIKSNSVEKYHFMLLRNLYEKTANFLGYPKWSDLLPDDKQTYYNRVIQFTSHSTLSNEAVPDPTVPEKNTVKFLLDHLIDNNYWKEEEEEEEEEEIITAASAVAEISTTQSEDVTV
jgi:wobble nucleotide-excising tRNase